MIAGPNIIAFSYAKRALVAGSRERIRMAEYSTVLSSYHVVVFTRASEGCAAYQEEDNLHLYATNSTSKIGMLIDAYKIGKRIIKTQSKKQWTLSAQDPLASSIVPLFLYLFKNVTLHVQVHGDIFSQYFFAGDRLRIMKRCYAQWVLSRAQKIRVVSERIKSSLLARHVPESRIVVLPIQADIDAFLQVGKTRAYEEVTVTKFLYVGRLAPEKNINLILAAFAQATSGGMSATLTLLGDGTQKVFLQDEVSKLGIGHIVEFLPWTDAVPANMAAADVLCLASWHEGYAMVLLEAMAAGLPVVTTDVGCVGSVVIDTESGRVVTDFTVASYAKVMQELAGDSQKRAQFGRAAHHKAQSLVLSHDDYLHAIAESFTI